MKECDHCFGICCVGSPNHWVAPLTDQDIKRISKHFGSTETEFRKQFVVRYGRGTVIPLQRLKFGDGPCHFWRQGRCGIYSVRPQACRDYTPVQLVGISCSQWHRMRAGV